jgi:asparagine synthase (glutamine-hydrolysing)
MCGIAGVFGTSDEVTVRAMLSALAHRGPDDEHAVAGPHFTLGARRLSILDVAEGRQPMCNEAGTIWAAQNGELYNFPECRRALLRAGHQLHTRCDTELLPHLYEDHGTRLPEYIDGMFAVAVWDAEKQTGLLARDRSGKKPLFYLRRGGCLYFASEIKALLQVPGFERQLNLEALHHFLSYKNVPHPLTIFTGISALPPAHALVFSRGGDVRLERYWDVSFAPDPALAGLAESELVDRLLALLRRGVERRLLSDVPIGFFLSGGLDSSLSTALAGELSPGRIKTFTLAYGPESTTAGKEADRHWARWVAQRYGTEHHEEVIGLADFPDTFRKILTSFDEPFAGAVSTYFLARYISRHVKVALAGDGADELFGSYLSHRLAGPLASFAAYQSTGDARVIRPFQDRPDYLARLAAPEDWMWRSKLLVFSEAEKAGLYAPDLARILAPCSTAEHLRRSFVGLTAGDPLNRILEAEFRTQLPDQVLAFVDRLSMAHSLEVRSAYLDTEFITFAAALPGPWKIREGETKYLLKQAARRYFPDEMVFRPKEGFVMPVNAWLLGSLQDYVRDTLGAGPVAAAGLFAPARVQQLVDAFYRGQTAHANQILTLLAYHEWHRLYRPAVGSRPDTAFPSTVAA